MPEHQHDGAAAPGPVTPTSDNAPWQARVGENGETDSPDCAEKANQRKRLADLQVTLAFQAIELHELRSGALLATGAGLVAHFGDLTAAEAWSKLRTEAAAPGAQFNAVQARLKLAGWTLTAGAGGDFTVSRWGQLRTLADMVAVESFARQIGGKL